jgi:hypothetical protein
MTLAQPSFLKFKSELDFLPSTIKDLLRSP